MLYAIVAVLALIIDQAVKYWTTVNIVVDTGKINLIPGLIHLANVHNTGGAFSLFEGGRWFFVVLCILFVLVVVYALIKDLITHPGCRWSAVLILAGAIGNCIDRIVCGYVVDMFEFDLLFFKHRFPVFNVADIYITLGVIVFCVLLLLEKPEEKAAPAAEAPAAPKAKKKPAARRRRQKIEIPTFEKREQPSPPAMNPGDPFAEWEKHVKPAPQTPPPAQPPQQTLYTQPVVTPPPAAAPSVAPVVPKPATPAAPKPSSDEFDLDSILAEFKDL